MASSGNARMPLFEHFREFRKRMVRAALAIVIASGFGWHFYNSIITHLAKPVCDLAAAQAAGATHCGALYISGVLGPLNLQIQVALLSGVILAAPIWLYQLWAFIAPGLHRKEKRNSILFVVSATPFFAAGATMGYLILPIAVLSAKAPLLPYEFNRRDLGPHDVALDIAYSGICHSDILPLLFYQRQWAQQLTRLCHLQLLRMLRFEKDQKQNQKFQRIDVSTGVARKFSRQPSIKYVTHTLGLYG